MYLCESGVEYRLTANYHHLHCYCCDELILIDGLGDVCRCRITNLETRPIILPISHCAITITAIRTDGSILIGPQTLLTITLVLHSVALWDPSASSSETWIHEYRLHLRACNNYLPCTHTDSCWIPETTHIFTLLEYRNVGVAEPSQEAGAADAGRPAANQSDLRLEAARQSIEIKVRVMDLSKTHLLKHLINGEKQIT